MYLLSKNLFLLTSMAPSYSYNCSMRGNVDLTVFMIGLIVLVFTTKHTHLLLCSFVLQTIFIEFQVHVRYCFNFGITGVSQKQYLSSHRLQSGAVWGSYLCLAYARLGLRVHRNWKREVAC